MLDIPIADFRSIADNIDSLAKLNLFFDSEVELRSKGRFVLEHGSGETFKKDKKNKILL